MSLRHMTQGRPRPAAHQMDRETYRHHLVQGLLDLAAQRDRLSGMAVPQTDMPVSPPGAVPQYGGAVVSNVLPSERVTSALRSNAILPMVTNPFAARESSSVIKPMALAGSNHSSRSVPTAAAIAPDGERLPQSGNETSFLSPLSPPAGLAAAMAPRMTDGDFRLSPSPKFEFRDYEPPLEPPSDTAKETVRPIRKPRDSIESFSPKMDFELFFDGKKKGTGEIRLKEIELPEREIQIGERTYRVDRRSHSNPDDAIVAAIYQALEISKKNKSGIGSKAKLPEVSTSILDIGESGFSSARFRVGRCDSGECSGVTTRVKDNSVAYLHLHPPGGGKDRENRFPTDEGDENDIESHREIVRGGYEIPAYLVTPQGGVIKYSSEFKKGIEVLPPGTFSWKTN